MPRLQVVQRKQQSGWFRSVCLMLLILGGSGAMLNAQSDYHHLILGSFKTFDKASEALSQVEQVTGRQPVILFPEKIGGWYRVSVYQSVNRAEVESYSQSLQRQGKSKGWILSLNPVPETTRGTSSATNTNRRTANPGMVSSPSETTYHLIAQSYTTYEAAQEGVADLQAKGMEPYVLFPTGPIQAYRVSVYAADNREEVNSYKRMLNLSGITGSWIHEEVQVSAMRGGASQSNARSRSNARTSGNSSTTFYLIVGSFERYDEATDFMEAARSKGSPAQILWPEDGQQGNFRISLFSSTNRQEVEAFKSQLQAKGMRSGWILVR